MIPKSIIEKKVKKQNLNKNINILPVTDSDDDGNVYLLGFVKEVTTKRVVYFPEDEPMKFPNYEEMKKYLDQLEKSAKVLV